MTKLWKHQQQAFDFAAPKAAALLGMGMGCGKSLVAIALTEVWRAESVLIICPTTVRPVWRRELAKHSTRETNTLILDTGSVAKRTKLADDAIKSGLPTIIVINYEAAWREPFASWARGRIWDVVILDESQRAQRESSTAFFCAQMRSRSHWRLCLTGTPLTQCPMSVWAQCRFLDPNVFGDNLKAFRKRFENKKVVSARKACAQLNAAWAKYGYGPYIPPESWLPSTLRTDEYLRRLGAVAIRIENAVLDLPPLTIEKRTFSLSPHARKLHDLIQHGHQDEIETGFWANIQGSFAITTRLQQITSGWLPDREGHPVIVDRGKAACLEDILSEAGGEPVVVFTRFVEDLNIAQRAAKKLGLRYAEISQRRKDGIDSLAQMPEHVQVNGVQEQAGGAGIDLSRARIAVDYSPSWSLSNWDQKIARLHRPPQDKPVIVYQLVADDSVDEQIHWALQARRGVIGQVWENLEKHSPHTALPVAASGCSESRYQSTPA